jgi:O-Antigen ligase/Tetratricopeptide repeat
MNLRLNASTVVLAAAFGLLVAALFFGGGVDDVDFLPVALAALFVAGAGVVATLSGLLPRPGLDGMGLAFFGFLGGFVVWSGLSVWWSIGPDLSWNLFNRELAYVAFAVVGIYVGAAVSRRTVATGLAIALGAVIAWALAGKVFPSLVEYGEQVARLRSPVGYWNALALLCVAAGVLGLWLATDAARGRWVRAAGAVLVYGAIVAVVLTYSRSGIAIMVLAALAWVVLGRAAFETLVVLALAVVAAAPVLVYAFLSSGITDDGQSYSVRAHDGAIFAPVLLAGAALVVGVALWLLGRSVPSARVRRTAVRATAAVLVAVALAALIASVARAGGPGPWIEARWHDFSSSTDVPSQQSSRFGSLSSNHRWTWWQEAWDSFEDAPGDGRGAGTFVLVNVLERTTPITVTQPHNLFLQALSDTGIVGFLLLLGAAVAAVLVSIRTVRRAVGPERLTALALAIVAGAYLVQSLVDVDWDFVAVSGFVFFAVGVLAARPATEEKVAPVWALAAAAGASVAAASLLLPWLSVRKTEDAYASIERGAYSAAAGEARSAHSLNSLAVEPLFALGLAESFRGHITAAERAYARAVREQPDNPETWFNLGDFELQIGDRKIACAFLTRATELDRFDKVAAARRDQACRR